MGPHSGKEDRKGRWKRPLVFETELSETLTSGALITEPANALHRRGQRP